MLLIMKVSQKVCDLRKRIKRLKESFSKTNIDRFQALGSILLQSMLTNVKLLLFEIFGWNCNYFGHSGELHNSVEAAIAVWGILELSHAALNPIRCCCHSFHAEALLFRSPSQWASIVSCRVSQSLTFVSSDGRRRTKKIMEVVKFNVCYVTHIYVWLTSNYRLDVMFLNGVFLTRILGKVRNFHGMENTCESTNLFCKT